jgi:hypothetical protein
MTNQRKSNPDQPTLDELITLSEAARISGFTTRHLRYLAENGELWARKLGRNWFTTTHSVEEYLARERHPGPKSKQHPNSS